jgi:signal transduction histidine kinase
LQSSIANNNRVSLSRVYLRLTQFYLETRNKDSAIFYSLKNLAILKTMGDVSGSETNLGTGYENVYLAYTLNNQFDSAFKYQGLALVTKDGMAKMKIKNLAEFQKLTYKEQLRLQALEQEKVQLQSRIVTWSLLAGLATVLLIGLILYRNNRQKQRANLILQEQKQKIETTLQELKSAQQQLIQSEKMASLGELTAGIAHEIQNPLNFVNNFSEVNTEIVNEAKLELNQGNYEEVQLLLNDIEENSAKINHHGKRADAIVKGMLQHSQSGKGQKELTDINALADEYLRLCYHGLRAKDNHFNATLQTDFDPAIGTIPIVPQEIGRVLLNLYNNAFYTVHEKARQSYAGFEPTVSVYTKKEADKIKIRVKDNGNGIAQDIIDKIFQPFFTTKPTGQGTGLGLSLSYDIVKAQGGELNVESKEGDGTTFIILLNY